jgi:aldehyde dehydrogenase
VAPVKGQYFDVITPITGQAYTQAARSTAEDIELALDAAHAAADKWGKTDATTRSNILLKIADRLEPTWSCWPTPRPWITASRSARR